MMAAQAAAPNPPPTATETAKTSPWFWKGVALAAVVAVIGGECLVAFMYISTATAEVAEAGGAGSGTPRARRTTSGKSDSQHATAGSGAHGASGEHGGHMQREIDLGEFSLTAFQPASNTTLLIDFHLFGTISGDDELTFAEHFESNKHRLRDCIIMTIRSAELADLTDPGLGLIKRQILEKTNRALGKPLLQGIIFSDFIVVEQ